MLFQQMMADGIHTDFGEVAGKNGCYMQIAPLFRTCLIYLSADSFHQAFEQLAVGCVLASMKTGRLVKSTGFCLLKGLYLGKLPHIVEPVRSIRIWIHFRQCVQTMRSGYILPVVEALALKRHLSPIQYTSRHWASLRLGLW